RRGAACARRRPVSHRGGGAAGGLPVPVLDRHGGPGAARLSVAGGQVGNAAGGGAAAVEIEFAGGEGDRRVHHSGQDGGHGDAADAGAAGALGARRGGGEAAVRRSASAAAGARPAGGGVVRERRGGGARCPAAAQPLRDNGDQRPGFTTAGVAARPHAT